MLTIHSACIWLKGNHRSSERESPFNINKRRANRRSSYATKTIKGGVQSACTECLRAVNHTLKRGQYDYDVIESFQRKRNAKYFEMILAVLKEMPGDASSSIPEIAAYPNACTR